MMTRRSIGKEAAIALAESGWWKDKTARQIASFQLFTTELSMPFDVFHKAVEESLGRPVWSHEFGSEGMKRIVPEFLGKAKAPSLREIMDLIPEDKRLIVKIDDKDEEWKS